MLPAGTLGLESERPRVTGKSRRVKQLPACGSSTSMRGGVQRVSFFRVCKLKLQWSHERKRALRGWNEISRSLSENSGPAQTCVSEETLTWQPQGLWFAKRLGSRHSVCLHRQAAASSDREPCSPVSKARWPSNRRMAEAIAVNYHGANSQPEERKQGRGSADTVQGSH